MDTLKVLKSLGLSGEEAKRLAAIDEAANEDEMHLMKLILALLIVGDEIQRLRNAKPQKPCEPEAHDKPESGET